MKKKLTLIAVIALIALSAIGLTACKTKENFNTFDMTGKYNLSGFKAEFGDKMNYKISVKMNFSSAAYEVNYSGKYALDETTGNYLINWQESNASVKTTMYGQEESIDQGYVNEMIYELADSFVLNKDYFAVTENSMLIAAEGKTYADDDVVTIVGQRSKELYEDPYMTKYAFVLEEGISKAEAIGSASIRVIYGSGNTNRLSGSSDISDITGVDFNVLGEQTATITYGDDKKTVSLPVLITPAVELTTKKSTYAVNTSWEDFLDGWTIAYRDEDAVPVTKDMVKVIDWESKDIILDLDLTKQGKYEISVSYKDVTDSVSVVVIDEANVAVDYMYFDSNSVEYLEKGTELSSLDIGFKVYYIDDTSETIVVGKTDGLTVEGYNKDKIGVQQIQFKYKNYVYNVVIYVYEKDNAPILLVSFANYTPVVTMSESGVNWNDNKITFSYMDGTKTTKDMYDYLLNFNKDDFKTLDLTDVAKEDMQTYAYKCIGKASVGENIDGVYWLKVDMDGNGYCYYAPVAFIVLPNNN